MKKLYFLPLIFLVWSCGNPMPQTLKLTKADYSGKWPFAVDEIEIYCDGYTEIYGRTNNGKIYALNGSAKGASHNNASVSRVEEIWLDDPDIPGLKISYGDFITKGLELCEKK